MFDCAGEQLSSTRGSSQLASLNNKGGTQNRSSWIVPNTHSSKAHDRKRKNEQKNKQTNLMLLPRAEAHPAELGATPACLSSASHVVAPLILLCDGGGMTRQEADGRCEATRAHE